MDCINDRDLGPDVGARRPEGARDEPATELRSDPASPPLLAAHDALYLDFDGTLVDLAPTPEALTLAPDLVGLLTRLQSALGGAVAAVSGRRLESIDRWLAPLRLRGAGLHGAQLRQDPGRMPVMADSAAVRSIVTRLVERFGEDPRVLIEDKGASVALHFRLAPERADDCMRALRAYAAAAGLDTVPGHCVIEARPRGIDKGTGLRQLAASPPFAGRRPVFVGDDTTDEDAIRAAQVLGGSGVRVGPAATAARYRLRDVAAVHDWLRASLRALERSA